MRGVGATRQQVRGGEEIPFEIGRRRIEAAHEIGIGGGRDERGTRAEAMRLEDLGHLGNRQPLGKCQGHDVDLAPGDFGEDVERRRRAIEPIFPRFQLARVAAQPERDAEGDAVANHAGRHETIADCLRAGSRRNLDELLLRAEALKGSVDPRILDIHGGACSADGNE